ncbi:MAG: hypothetical protein RM021_013450 [Nostoc sp. EkiNYC01]|nr:hypothetical protein [Nostoc sp. EkiNYC01]
MTASCYEEHYLSCSGFISSLEKAVDDEADLPEQNNFIELASISLEVFCTLTFLIPIITIT